MPIAFVSARWLVVQYLLCTKFSSLCKFLRQFGGKKFTPEERLGRGKKEKMMKIEKTIFWVIIIFQEVYTRTREAGERKRGENDENGEQIFW